MRTNMLNATNIDTSAVVSENGEPIITVQMDGSDLMTLLRSVGIAGTVIQSLHDRFCTGDEDDPANDSLHVILDEVSEVFEALETIVEATDAASPECPGCGVHHFHQTESPVNMSDEELAEVIQMFSEQQ
jgi:hypothetical protein